MQLRNVTAQRNLCPLVHEKLIAWAHACLRSFKRASLNDARWLHGRRRRKRVLYSSSCCAYDVLTVPNLRQVSELAKRNTLKNEYKQIYKARWNIWRPHMERWVGPAAQCLRPLKWTIHTFTAGAPLCTSKVYRLPVPVQSPSLVFLQISSFVNMLVQRNCLFCLIYTLNRDLHIMTLKCCWKTGQRV